MYQINLTLFILFSILKNNFHYFFYTLSFNILNCQTLYHILFYKVINKGGGLILILILILDLHTYFLHVF